MIGTRLGPYEITAKLGEGGMGQVFQAKDFQLGRNVALKILPEGFTVDPERLQRFEREAKLLAQLNHPNIAQIYGFEASGETRALVMELVEGPTLAERLEQGPFPFNESLSVSLQIAHALEEAHGKGIVHRDLKPQNIKASIEGKVKVLDFGLAKAMDPIGGSAPSASQLAHSPTMTIGATRDGMILGTAAYMAPEQARGGAIDKRADIWAFGVVLYEMLTGERLFAEGSVVDTLSAVMRKEIDLGRLPAATPRRLRDLLRRCLERNPKNRLHDIADARLELEDELAHPDVAAPAVAAAAPRRGRWAWPSVAALLAAALVASLWFRPAGPSAASDAVKTSRLVWNLPAGLLPIPLEEESPLVAISPDGTTLAAVLADGAGKRQLYVRALASLESRALPGTEGASEPFFAPDGKSLAFFADGELRKVAIESGRVSKLADAIDSRGGAWSPDGTLVVVPEIDLGLVQTSDSGANARTVVKPDKSKGERTFRWPQVLPGGRAALFTVGTMASPDFYDDATIEAVVLATGERKRVYEGASFARYSPAAGELVLGRAGGLLAVPFDLERLEVTGRPRPVLDGVASDVTTGAVHASVATDGTLVYLATESRAAESRLAWISAAGEVEPIGAPARTYWSWSVSPDGTKIVALTAARDRGELWIYDLSRDVFSRFSINERCYDPLWSPDGRYIVYSRAAAVSGTEIVRRPPDGGEAELLVTFPKGVAYVRSIPDDGSRLFYEAQGDSGQVSDIYSMPFAPGAPAERVVSTREDEYFPSISPDGRWLAYISQHSGRGEVYLRPFPESGGRIQISNQGGAEPRWSADGRTLYFRSANAISRVDLRFEPRLEASAPRPIAGIRLSARRSLFTYTLQKDGRFLAILPGEDAQRSEIVVVLEWAAELRRSLAAAGGTH
jgi:Tol biopolymer transport system component